LIILRHRFLLINQGKLLKSLTYLELSFVLGLNWLVNRNLCLKIINIFLSFYCNIVSKNMLFSMFLKKIMVKLINRLLLNIVCESILLISSEIKLNYNDLLPWPQIHIHWNFCRLDTNNEDHCQPILAFQVEIFFCRNIQTRNLRN